MKNQPSGNHKVVLTSRSWAQLAHSTRQAAAAVIVGTSQSPSRHGPQITLHKYNVTLVLLLLARRALRTRHGSQGLQRPQPRPQAGGA